MTHILAVGWFLMSAASLEVGVSKRAITPHVSKDRSPVYLAGFSTGRRAVAVSGDIDVRTIVFAFGSQAVSISSVDVVGLFRDQVLKVRQEVFERLKNRDGVPSSLSVNVVSTHTHAGPDTMGLWGSWPLACGASPGYLAQLREAIVESILEALASRKEASLTVAKTEVGDLIRDTRSPQVKASTMTVFEARARDETVVTFVNVSVHPEVLWGDNTILSADFPYFLRREMEEQRGGLSLYTSGALGGLMTPRRLEMEDPETGLPAPRGSLRHCELYGTELAQRAVDAIEEAQPVEVDGVRVESREVSIPLQNWKFSLALWLGVLQRDVEQDQLVTEVGFIELGPIQMAMIPGELFAELWRGGVESPEGADFEDAEVLSPLRDTFPGPFSMVLGLANDEIGYIIPESQWDVDAPYTYGRDKAPYGEINSVGPKASPVLIRALEEMVSSPGDLHALEVLKPRRSLHGDRPRDVGNSRHRHR